ncbi:DUF6463 family protein [Streptomyces coeruleorubidus]|uniref:DUF6463 family protein n=1 Tax=Streptomyces coeruleorubidus TaxID=116188 RepID=A0ABZ0K3H1_STRC4|nr:DUF6463 family protein [Streptomyces coeruleorubidus]WOT32662.1 DUF6463 family protein [Streptomyces coeruleorubidus]
MTRLIPRLVIGLTAVHFVVALIASNTFGDVARDGFWNAVPGRPQREYEMWFFLAGFGLLALGTLSQRIARDTGRLPAQLGWYLLAIGVPLQILYPVSGAPGLIVLGVLALIAARRDSAGKSRRTPLSTTTDREQCS